MSVVACKFLRGFGAAQLSSSYGNESITAKYRITLDTPSDDWPTILEQAQQITTGGGNYAPPLRGEAWPSNPGYGLFAKEFSFEIEDPEHDLLSAILTVQYLPLEAGERNPEQANDNPLLWETTYDIQYIEEEFVVEQAKNVQGFTGNPARPAGTLGPVTNSAGDETEEPIVETERVPVIYISKYVPSLDYIVAQNVNYARTTNSDNFLGASARRAKFIGADSGGRQIANGVSFYQMVTKVAIYKTTDRVVNNVGWNELDAGKKKKIVLKDDSDSEPSSPLFLDLAGKQTKNPTTITYRYLDEVPYAGLL